MNLLDGFFASVNSGSRIEREMTTIEDVISATIDDIAAAHGVVNLSELMEVVSRFGVSALVVAAVSASKVESGEYTHVQGSLIKTSDVMDFAESRACATAVAVMLAIRHIVLESERPIPESIVRGFFVDDQKVDECYYNAALKALCVTGGIKHESGYLSRL